MLLKVLSIVVILILIYIFFFKNGRGINIAKKKDESIEDDMVECPTCKTYVSQNEAILSNGKFYCSKECIVNK